MGYYDSEFNEAESDYARLHRWPLPEEYAHLILTREQVEERLSAGEDPIDLSLEKWERIYQVYKNFSKDLLPYKYYYSLYKRIGYETCALCLDSTNKYIQQFGPILYHNDKCKVCALAVVERCTAAGSTYLAIDHLLFDETGIERTPFKSEYEEKNKLLGELLETMIENIKSLKK